MTPRPICAHIVPKCYKRYLRLAHSFLTSPAKAATGESVSEQIKIEGFALTATDSQTGEPAKLYVVGDVSHMHIGPDGYMTCWSENPKTGKRSRKRRRYVGSPLAV